MTQLRSRQKKEITKRVRERAAELGDRLERIRSGRAPPRIDQLKLNEAKEYRLGIVFIDISQFTDYVFAHEERDTLRMVGLFIPEVIEIVRDYGGYFEKNTGDGVLAYFGAGEDDETAVRMVLDYLATVKWALANHVNPRLEEWNQDLISISAGATYGTTFVARIGAKSGTHAMNRLTAVSEVANIASRLEEKAGENEYLVGSRIRQLAQDTGWAGHLDYSQPTDYEWYGKDRDRRLLAYNFTGEWEGTESANLET